MKRRTNKALADAETSKHDYHLVMTVAGEFFVGHYDTLEKLAESVVEQLKVSYLAPVRVLVFYGERVKCLAGGNPLFPIIEFRHEEQERNVSTKDVVKSIMQDMPEGVLFGSTDTDNAQDPSESGAPSSEDLFGF